MRIITASLLLIAINATAFVPADAFHPAADYAQWAPAVSIVLALYLLIHAAFLQKPSSQTQTATAPEKPTKPAEPAPPPAAPKTVDREPIIDAYLLQFLALLQEKGRFLDFVMGDIANYSNEQIGGAARVVHQGCSKVVKDHFAVVPVSDADEGSSVTLESGYNPREFRAVGKLAGSPPFHGTLLHKGWKASKIDLPRIVEPEPAAKTSSVIVPAEVEVKAS